MATPLASLVHKRYGLLSILLLVSLTLTVWFTTLNVNGWYSLWIVSALLHALAFLFALSVSFDWDLKRISFKLRSGMLIKIVFWCAGIFTVFSGIVTYLVVIEQKNLFWPIIALFVVDLTSLIFGMSVRYAIEEEIKIKKVCEFC